MIRRTLRESITIDDIHHNGDETRHTITAKRKRELQAEVSKLSYFFEFDQLLNFRGDLRGIQSEDYNQQTSWFFYFIDIIFVATIFNISHLITKCGEDTQVYIVAASYFSIMFSTRMFFDTFTSILQASGVLHTMIFILYGLGVYCMTVNIAAVNDSASISAICESVLISGDNGLNIDGVIQSQSSLSSYSIVNEHVTSYFQSGNGTVTSSSHDFGSCREAENFSVGFAVSFLFTRFLIFALFFLYCKVFHHVQSSNSPNSNTPLTPGVELSSINNVNSANNTRTTSNTTIDREQQTELHNTRKRRIFRWKIVPLLVSCFLMLFLLAGFPATLVLPAVALTEVVGDIVPQLMASLQDLRPDRSNLEERLGLMFMLVLGETMLGFLVQRGNAIIDAQTYNTLIPAYVLVIAVGIQYFKNAQFPHLETGKHPLDKPFYSALYIYLNAVLSFMMLLVSNGLVEIYKQISEEGLHSRDVEELTEMHKVAVGLFAVWVILLWLHLLEGMYWDAVVSTLWRKLLDVLRISGGQQKDESSCRVCMQEAGGESTTEVGNSDSSNHMEKRSGSIETSQERVEGRQDDEEGRQLQQQSNPLHSSSREGEAVLNPRPSSIVSRHSRYPYSLRRHSQNASIDSEHRQFSEDHSQRAGEDHRQASADHRQCAGEDHGQAPADHRQSSGDHRHTTTSCAHPPPPIFNKRLFVLKLVVAVLHLLTIYFHIDAQYFVVVSAVVALQPQLWEVAIEFLDLRNRLKQIKQELEISILISEN